MSHNEMYGEGLSGGVQQDAYHGPVMPDEQLYSDPLRLNSDRQAIATDYPQQEYIYDSSLHDPVHANALHSDPNNGHYDDSLKEVADAGVQVGNSLMNVNLKPKPEDQLISVLRIRLGSLFVAIEAQGANSVVKVSAETLHLNELGHMKYGKLLDPRGLIGARQQEKRQINMDSITGSGVLKLRLGTGTFAEQLASSDGGGNAEEVEAFADIRLNTLAAALLQPSDYLTRIPFP